jgi:hypothetical protein
MNRNHAKKANLSRKKQNHGGGFWSIYGSKWGSERINEIKKEIQNSTWDQTKRKVDVKLRADLPIKMEDFHANIVTKHSVKAFMQ